MATLHAKNREKLPHGIMARLHNPRLVVHMSPDKAGQAVHFKPPFNTFVFDHDVDGVYHCIQERMAVFFSLSKRVTLGSTSGRLSQNQTKSLDITRFTYQQSSIIIVIIIHSKYFAALTVSNPSAFRLGG